MSKEYTYDIDKYTIGVDENGEDGIGMTVAKIEKGGIKFLGNCYGENARCIDLLIKENQELKKQLEDITLCRDIASGHREEVQDRENILLNQQKAFIKWLEDLIKFYKNRDSYMVADIHGSYDLNNIELELLEEILQKYKSIIGVLDENNKQ